MLKINTYLDRSATHGIGLFAAEDIAAGTEIWVYCPEVDLTYSEEQWLELQQKLSPQSFRALRKYSYKEGGCFWLCLDNAQFMNHCRETYNVGNDKTTNTMVARHDIKKGEELLCNYFAYSDPDDIHLRCLCSLPPEPR